MDSLKKARQRKGLSQRGLARLAGVSYKTLQLMESGRHDPRLSTLQKIAGSLGYPPNRLEEEIDAVFAQPEDSIAIISERISRDGEASWKIWLFNFVDAFRSAAQQDKGTYIVDPPAPQTPPKIQALLAATVETLCAECGVTVPSWCVEIPALDSPWFVANIESLKPMALVMSPVHFRKRNLFVLDNFLERR